ncbi:MAG: HNH endonuclease [Candidatus Thiodiazotropha sp. (ex Epidulcina cf. delphinae)]|nr:HNH endonuclease [Candidatus Thiodiazotropha sp. (ex Epidulcina cf. delphinae)]
MSAPKKKSPYGYRWQKAREAFLAKYPLCAEHARLGQTVVATVVDHVEPHRGCMKLFWDRDNWQSLCKQCHDVHKQRFEKSGRVSGCDEFGNPIDPTHHWNNPGGRGG